MSSQGTESVKETPTRKEVFDKCWGRLKMSADWLCDPEGPPLGKYIIDMILRFLGLIMSIYGTLVLFDSFTLHRMIIFNLEMEYMRYLGTGSLLLGSTLYFLGKHAKRMDLKTAAYLEDIDALVCDVEQNLHRLDDEKKRLAECEIRRIKYFKEKPSEVSVKRLTCLQKVRVDVLDDNNALIAYAQSKLSEYKFLVGNHEDYTRYETIIKDGIFHDMVDDLRPHLKELCEEINEERFSIGCGEAVLESLSHWSIPAMVSLFIIGVNPLLSDPYMQNELKFLHWGFLGMTGAILYSVNYMRKLDTTKVGEDEGNVTLRFMLLGIMVGAISAILLYASIRSGIFGGKALPTLNVEVGTDEAQTVNNALSVLWGIAAGFSAKLAERLVGSTSSATTA